MNSETTDPTALYGDEVRDSAGKKLGTVDGVWLDDATNELEFVGVKTGFIMGKTHLIPLANAQVADGAITLAYTEDQIKDAPSFASDQELSPEDEDAIYGHFGLNRSTAPSPSGLPAGTPATEDGNTVASTGETGDLPTPPTHVELSLAEENLVVGKRQVEAGHVRLRKVVHTEHQEVPVELRREEVEIERIPAPSTTAEDSAFQNEEIDVPVMREEAVVGTATQVTEQVRLNKNVRTEAETIRDEVRREDVEIDQGTVDQYVHTPDESRV